MTTAEADTSLHTTALRYLQQGWEPLPLPPNTKSPPPGGHTGYRGAPVTQTQWDRWNTHGVKITDGPITIYTGPIQGCNLGLRMPEGVIGIDIDHYWTPSRDKQGGNTITALETRLGNLPPTYSSTSRPGTPSKILFYRIQTGIALITKLEDVEIIQHHHRYAAIAPSAHPDGRPYRWYDPQDWDLNLDDIPNVEDLTELPWEWVEHLRAHGKTGAASTASTTEVREFIRTHIANTQPQAMGGLRTALTNATGARHDTLVTVACWAMREAAAGRYPAEEAIRLLAGWWSDVMDDPDRAGTGGGEFGSAILWAVGQTNADPDRVAELRAKPPDDDWDWIPGGQNTPSTSDDTTEPAPNRIRANFHMGAAIWDLPAVEWLIDETIQADGLTVIYGAPKSFKTFVALDMAMHLANGINWRGLETKPATVLYVCAEGAPGVGPRVRAWCNRHGGNIDRIGWVTVAPNLFAADGDTWHVGELAAEIGAGLVIIDTLARAMPGGDENSAKDIGYVIANFDSIREQAGCALIAVHHTGKDAARGMRGSSSLQGAVDTSLEVVGDANAVNVRVADQKNAESDRAWWFKPTREQPSLVLEPTTGSGSSTDTRDANILHQLVILDHGGGVSTALWADAAEDRGICKRSLLHERIAVFKDGGLIENVGTSKRPGWRLTAEGRVVHDDATT